MGDDKKRDKELGIKKNRDDLSSRGFNWLYVAHLQIQKKEKKDIKRGKK